MQKYYLLIKDDTFAVRTAAFRLIIFLTVQILTNDRISNLHG
jgi:hypothetical protein